MRVVYHPDFPQDIKRFERQYRDVSNRLALRFHEEVEKAIDAVKASPGSAGHFVNTGSAIVKEVRRRNLKSFPFFVLYGVADDLLVFRSLIATASDPLTWIRYIRSLSSRGISSSPE